MALDDFRLRFGKAVMELIGTAVLVLTIQLSLNIVPYAAPIAVGLAFIAIVYVGGPVSGAHYNPAVSLAVFIRGRLSFQNMILYWIFQVGGGVCGALLGALIGGKTAPVQRGADYYLLQALLAELVFTALLALTVLGTATNDKVDGNSYYGAAIGLVILAGAFTCHSISGAVFNPAVAIGLGIISGFKHLTYCLAVIAVNLGGGICGALLFYIVAPDEFVQISEEATGMATGMVGEAARLLPGHRGGEATQQQEA